MRGLILFHQSRRELFSLSKTSIVAIVLVLGVTVFMFWPGTATLAHLSSSLLKPPFSVGFAQGATRPTSHAQTTFYGGAGANDTSFRLITATAMPAMLVADVVKDFSIATNPNGAWSYGYSNTLGGAFTLHTQKDVNVIPGIERWGILRATTTDINPSVNRNTTNSDVSGGTNVIPPNMLLLHPGAEGQYSIVRWVAPAVGVYKIEGAFKGLDMISSTASTDDHILLNATTSLFSTTIHSFGETKPFSITRTLAAGDKIDFAVGYGDNQAFQNDSTGLTVTITPSDTEPAKDVDVSVTVTAEEKQVTTGDEIPFAIQVINRGPNEAANVVLSNKSSAGIKYAPQSPSNNICQFDNNSDCKIGNLAIGQGRVILLNAKVSLPGKILAKFTVSSDNNDLINDNNLAMVEVSSFPTIIVEPARTYFIVWRDGQREQLADSNLDTIVLVHGLQNKSGDPLGELDKKAGLWIGNSAKAARSLIERDLKARNKRANIIQYVWEDAFQVAPTAGLHVPIRSEYNRAKEKAANAGRKLAKFLLDQLGRNYSNKIHFIGHSLGTGVSAYAASSFFIRIANPIDSQFTVLDRPDRVRAKIPGTDNIVGYNKLFLSQMFQGILETQKQRFLIDNYYADPNSSGFGVGDEALEEYNIRIRNQKLTDPNDIGDHFFEEDGIDNDHFGVQQWYRLTMAPNVISELETRKPVCLIYGFNNRNNNGVFGFNLNDSLDPCEEGWYHSLLGPSPQSFSLANNNLPKQSLLAITQSLLYDTALPLSNIEGIKNCGQLIVSPANGISLLACNETPLVFFTADIDLPFDSESFSFDYKFAGISPSDNATVYIDDVPFWSIFGEELFDDKTANSGPLQIAKLTGKHRLTVALKKTGSSQPSFSISNLLLTQVKAGNEGSLTPRPYGKANGAVSIADGVQAGRFASGLDLPEGGREFQRADCAPKAILGDGRITLADWVQAGRYAAGLDPIVPAGGPTAQAASLNAALSPQATNQFATENTSSEVRIGQPAFGASTVTLPIEMVSAGNENAIGFSLTYDPALLFNPVAVLGTDASAASLIINPNQVGSGRLGIALGLPAGQIFAAGTRQIVRITFNLASASLGKTVTVGFGNSPVQQEVVDALANSLMATFTGANVIINNPKPTITALTPASAFAGDAGFTIGVLGTGFLPSSVVRWNGSNLVTTFQSAVLVTASVPSALIASAGTASITVANPAPGGGDSNTTSFAIINPFPVLTGLGFSTIGAGGAAGTLEVMGNAFVPSSIVSWNGSPRPTRFVSRTRLIVDYAAADILCAGIVRVTVVSPAPGGGTSSAQTFSIAPTIANLSPAEVAVGGAAFTLTVNGTGFCNGTRIRVNGTARTSTIVSPTQITTTITAADISVAGTLQISVVSADGVISNTISLMIKEPPLYEADVAPRPNGNGNGSVTMADWVQLGRFFVGLDTPALGSEFQRADCAPKATLGDGAITISDWVQAGRYAAGLDAVMPAGGPTTLASQPKPLFTSALSAFNEAQARMLRLKTTNFQRGQIGLLPIELDAQGNENAIAFTLDFDPKQMSFVDAVVGDGANGAALQIGRSQAANGRVGCAVVLPPGQQLLAGTRTLLTLRFIPNGGDGDVVTNINFSDQLLAREVVDAFAAPIPQVGYAGGTIAIRGRAAAHVSGASYINAELAADSIASAFGTGLASMTTGAVSLPLPNVLGGTSVKVKDALGVERTAPLFFVSPTQINYQIPAGTADGIASVTITNGLGEVTSGLLNIARVAPGIFSADASGKGWAAAEVVSVASDGTQTMSQVARFDVAQNKIVAVPIDVQTNVAVLVLYGTGIRQRSDVAQVKVKVGGIEVVVEYAGAQTSYAGLDQINAIIPRSLSGRGEVTIELSVEGKSANPVKMYIR